jgi:hypothetical protein
MRTLTWMPREPEVFGQPTRPRSSSDLAHHARDRDDLRPLHAGHGIEVDAQLVGMVEVLRAHRVRVQLEAAEVRHPGQRGRVARHDLLRVAARGKRSADHLDPVGRAAGARFW